jgi:chromosome segregation ATPase
MKVKAAVAIVLMSISTISMALDWGKITGNKQAGELIGTLWPGDKKESSIELADMDSPIEQLAEEDIRKSKRIGEILGDAAVIYATKKWCEEHSCNPNNPVDQLAISTIEKQARKPVEAMSEQVGVLAANRRRQYASEYDYLESEIEASEKAISIREKDIQSNNKEIESSSQEIKTLQDKSALTQQDIRTARTLQANTEQQLAESKLTLAQYDEKLDYLDASLKNSESAATKNKEDKARWEEKYSNLKQKRDALLGQRAVIASQNDNLTRDQKALNNLLG